MSDTVTTLVADISKIGFLSVLRSNTWFRTALGCDVNGKDRFDRDVFELWRTYAETRRIADKSGDMRRENRFLTPLDLVQPYDGYFILINMDGQSSREFVQFDASTFNKPVLPSFYCYAPNGSKTRQLDVFNIDPVTIPIFEAANGVLPEPVKPARRFRL